MATVRALKLHGGGPDASPGRPLPSEYVNENIPLVRAGCANLAKHIQNVLKFGVTPVVAVNKFTTDTDGEVECIIEGT